VCASPLYAAAAVFMFVWLLISHPSVVNSSNQITTLTNQAFHTLWYTIF